MLCLKSSDKDMQKYADESVTRDSNCKLHAMLRLNAGRDLMVTQDKASSQNRFRVCLTEDAGNSERKGDIGRLGR